MKTPTISISLFNSDSTIASIGDDDDVNSIRLCKVSGQGPAAQRKCCQQAIKALDRLAAKFLVLSGEPEPAKVRAQEKVNSGKFTTEKIFVGKTENGYRWYAAHDKCPTQEVYPAPAPIADLANEIRKMDFERRLMSTEGDEAARKMWLLLSELDRGDSGHQKQLQELRGIAKGRKGRQAADIAFCAIRKNRRSQAGN